MLSPGCAVLVDIGARDKRRRELRWVISIFIGAQMLGLAGIVIGRVYRTEWDAVLPKFAVGAVFIWHFLGLGIFVLICAVLLPILFLRKIITLDPAAKAPLPRKTSQWNRREFIGFAAALAPPVFTLSLSAIAMAQLNQFRVRRFVVPIRNLPPDLAGTTIAQVSDIHIRQVHFRAGPARNGEGDQRLPRRSRSANRRPDQRRAIRLVEGLDLVRAMQSRFGVYIIEGNHDLIESAWEFEKRVKESGHSVSAR